MEKIIFNSGGDKIVGNLYFPEDYDAEKKYKGVIVMGSWTTVKEQMSGLYAMKMSENGFVVLAFDPRGFGESEGEPRFFESPTKKIVDVNSAVEYMKSRSYIESVSLLGVCAGAGYVLSAASENKDVSSVATVASWIHDGEAVKMFYGGEKGVSEKIEAAKAAKKKYEETGEMDYIKSISETDQSAAMYGPYDYYLNPERGGIQEWSDDKFAVASWEDWLTFDPTGTAVKLTVPTMMIHSDGAVLPEYTKAYFENIAADDKELVWIETDMQSPMHQFSFYDQAKEVDNAVEMISEWFA